MADSMEPCKMLWADPCAMATEFGLGTEIQSPTGLFSVLSVLIHLSVDVCIDDYFSSDIHCVLKVSEDRWLLFTVNILLVI